MQSSKKELVAAIERIKDLPILVVGDVMLDRYIWGRVERISPEAPVPVVRVTKIEDRLGGAGNVARNLAMMGAKVGLAGFVGDDPEGKVFVSLLEQMGISKNALVLDRERPTSLKTRVIAHAQQVVRIDREDSKPPPAVLCEGFAAMVDAQIDAVRAVIVSDYGKGAVSAALMRKLAEGRKSGRLSLSDRPLVLDPHPASYSIYQGVNIAKPNRREAEEASGVKITDQQSGRLAAEKLLARWEADVLLLTLGEDGLLIVSKSGSEPLFLPTVALQVHDVSGAGDTVTALFSAAWASGSSPQVSGELANLGAGIVVAEVGTSSVTPEKLLREIERLAIR